MQKKMGCNLATEYVGEPEQKQNSDSALLEGQVSVAAALQSPYRDVRVVYVRADRDDRPLRWLEHRAREAGVPVERRQAGEIDALAEGSSHGGVVALVGERRTVDLADLLPAERPAFVVMLDGVEDPFNFGQAVRSLYAAGVDGLVLRPRNWLSAAATVARSSAGASELIPTAIAESAEDAAHFFQSRGLVIACAAEEEAVPINEADLTRPLFLLVGGEKRGITRSFLRQADLRLAIPYGREFRHSLGVTAAVAIFGYEVMRQRAVKTQK
jgi:23S rRNA (guanosine2251-2'-O)-methyltransferase